MTSPPRTPKLVDLTLPVRDHFRWKVDRRLVGDYKCGDLFQVTWLGWSVHGFTHIDSPRHISPEGFTTSEIDLASTTGPAAIIDLCNVGANDAITDAHLADAGGHIRAGDIVLLKTCWDDRASINSPEFWTTAPYMTRAASEWLRARAPAAVGFDFPQDYPIRGLLDGKTPDMTEMVTHDVLLRNGIILMEYLCNMKSLTTPRATVYALPLKIPDSDGAPARIVAIEE